ncbi:MAG: GNAT family N-acetyltransferase [Bacteroidota bacterium]
MILNLLISIRLLHPHETIQLKRLTYLALFVPYGEAPFPIEILEKEAIKKYYTKWNQTGDTALGLFNNQQLVGACWTRLFKATNPGYGFIDANTPELNIALFPNYRNQGWGSQLIRQVLAANREKGYLKVSLSCDTRNPAFGLYERLGFQTVQLEKYSATMLKTLRTAE